jgi:hypothetical protein
MKLSEISRYWAAKELTAITVDDKLIKLHAPFATPDFTLKINGSMKNPTLTNCAPLQKVNNIRNLKSGTFFSEYKETFICFDLKKGETEIVV